MSLLLLLKHRDGGTVVICIGTDFDPVTRVSVFHQPLNEVEVGASKLTDIDLTMECLNG